MTTKNWKTYPSRLVQGLAAMFRNIFRARTKEKYHPERHYMRGPGPKAKANAGAHRS